MKVHFFSQLSLKTRVTLSTLAIFVASIWVLSFVAGHLLQQDMVRLLGEQQYSTVSVAAEAVNDNFLERKNALAASALKLNPKLWSDPMALTAQLEALPVLLQLFNGGLWASDARGTAIAEAPRQTQRISVNYMDMDFIAAALMEGKTSVSSPIIGKKLQSPIFVISTPIRDAQGNVIGSLNGVTNLSEPNFLDKITRGQYGKTGGYILVEPKSRLVLTATDKSRIMEVLPKPGVNRYVDRNIAGYEGYSVLVNARNEEQLASVKQIPAAGWYMLLGTPVAEAFAPIRQLRERILLFSLVLTLLAAWFTWWMLKRQLQPLVFAANAMVELTNTPHIPLPLPVGSQDEIGKLMRGFNHLIETWKNREAALAEGKAKLEVAASVFTHALEGIFIADRDNKVVDVNAAFTRITGYAAADTVGQSANLLNSDRHSSEFFSDMRRCVETQGFWYGEIWIQRKSGEIFLALQTTSVVRDASGAAQYQVSFLSDITERKEHEDRLEQIAHFDSLTNLPNRVLLADRMQQAMAQVRRRQLHLAVIYLDLDGFKSINDRYGHDAGDDVLIAMAARMKHTLREGDTLARIGGDEFVAILIDMESQDACIPLLNRLREAAAIPVQLGDIAVEVSASLGVTFYPQHEEMDADQLLRQADQAMYQAKVAGKNRYQIFDSDKDNSIRIRHESVGRMELALERGEFVLFYQPKVNMRSGQVVGAEALIRWQHPEKGLLSPAQFLPAMEDHPLAIAVGEWVIDTVLTQIEAWHTEGLEMPVSVNIGPQQLQQKGFGERLAAIMADHPCVPAGHLELEVLETSALDDVSQVSKLIEACAALGVDFALDDFGTGYSSLTYLRRLRVKTLKIDQSFVRDMLKDVDDLAILKGVIGLASAFKRQVIAEGVETVAHGTALLQLGCDLAQGYGIARPMPAEQMLTWVANWRPDSAWSA